ncbi:MAG TPA: cytochrome ubiquinol oxidase subunit I [Acidimicrobiales bacterium]|nr:cytochrome ubiquinol oxidase subunit I [Acidimicrobiales bacterium]
MEVGVGSLEFVLAQAADNLYPARMQMAISLGWHIVFSCLGVAFPAMVMFAEWRGHRTGDAALHELAHTWAKAMGVLFAAGAVSGTLLTFEMGILWPGLMNTYGEIFGFPFVLEGFSFFIEAIFVGIYLFGWSRLSPRAHILCAVPMILAGMAGTFFVVAANAWMNNPVGFDVAPDGTLTNVDPIAGMFAPSMPPQVAHMWIAAFMVTGFGIASVYAVGMLRARRDGGHGDGGHRDRYLRYGMLIPLTVAAAFTPIQIGVGDWIANVVAENQPAKLAAMEAQYETQAGAPLSLGGIYYDDELHYALEVPYGLSLLIHHDPDGVVAGLEEVPEQDRPPVNVVHLAYNTMVGAGSALLLLALVYGFAMWKRRHWIENVWFLRAVAVSGLLAVAALETGWITTEVGRQPWIVYGHLRTADAVSPAPGLFLGFYAVVVIYAVLTVFTVYVLRRLASRHDVAAPYEGTSATPDDERAGVS